MRLWNGSGDRYEWISDGDGDADVGVMRTGGLLCECLGEYFYLEGKHCGCDELIS